MESTVATPADETLLVGEPGKNQPPSDVKLVEDFFRALLVAEKNCALYPRHGQVVQQSLDTFHAATEKALDEIGPFRLHVAQNTIRYEEATIYEEETRGVAFRLYKDGIREIVFFPGISRQELEDLLDCLCEARSLEDDDDDFITLFWEKDCASIRVHMADDFISGDDLPQVPPVRGCLPSLLEERFSIPESEKARLGEILERRKADTEAAESGFELSEEEQQAIHRLTRSEEAYFPILDFLDILLEMMVRDPDAESFTKTVRMIRSIMDALIEKHDFERAAFLMTKFSQKAHPALSHRQSRELNEMVAGFNDKKTLHVLEEFLRENPKLSPDHTVFNLMKVFPRSAAECFCKFLAIGVHLKAVSDVLVHIGTGKAEVFAKQLGDPDPLVVRAMVTILLRTDDGKAVQRIARALKHPDEGVRVHAARTMLEHGDTGSGRFLLPLLKEPSRHLLNVALQFFSKFPVVEAFDALVELVRSKRFLLLDVKRQEMTFKALLKASPSNGLDFVRRKVLRWTVTLTDSALRRKCAALAALGHFSAGEAVELITRFASSARGPLAAAAERALREWHARWDAPTRDGAPGAAALSEAGGLESEEAVETSHG